MAKFICDLDAHLREDSENIWVLKNTLIYQSDLVGKVIVPVGFQTDFASVPRLPVIYSLWGARAHREAVIHDYLFRINAIPNVDFNMANKVFLEAMKCRGKSVWIRYPMYWGVCLGSKKYYHKKKVMDQI